jgi:hypothetical protein
MSYFIVFIAVMIVDIIWTLYIKWIQENHAIRAGCAAMGIYALGAYAILSYTKDPTYIIPACLGAFIGTFSTILIKKTIKLVNEE